MVRDSSGMCRKGKRLCGPWVIISCGSVNNDIVQLRLFLPRSSHFPPFLRPLFPPNVPQQGNTVIFKFRGFLGLDYVGDIPTNAVCLPQNIASVFIRSDFFLHEDKATTLNSQLEFHHITHRYTSLQRNFALLRTTTH